MATLPNNYRILKYTATQNQKTFLVDWPIDEYQDLYFRINNSLAVRLAGDYTYNFGILTLENGLNAGDKIMIYRNKEAEQSLEFITGGAVTQNMLQENNNDVFFILQDILKNYLNLTDYEQIIDFINEYIIPLLPDLAINIPDATETVKGILKLSTHQQTYDGLNDTTAITPLKLKKKVDDAIDDMTDIIDEKIDEVEAKIDNIVYYTNTGIISGLQLLKINDNTLNINTGVCYVCNLETNVKSLSLIEARQITFTTEDLNSSKYIIAEIGTNDITVSLNTSPQITSNIHNKILLGYIYVDTNNNISHIVDLREFITGTNKTLYEKSYKPEIDTLQLKIENNNLIVLNNGIIEGRALKGLDPVYSKDVLGLSNSNPDNRFICMVDNKIIKNGSNVFSFNLNGFKSFLSVDKYYFIDVYVNSNLELVLKLNNTQFNTISLALENGGSSQPEKTLTKTHSILVKRGVNVGSNYSYIKLFKLSKTGEIINDTSEFSIDQLPVGTILEGHPSIFSDKWTICDGEKYPATQFPELAAALPDFVREYIAIDGGLGGEYVETLATIPNSVRDMHISAELSCATVYVKEGNYVYAIFGLGTAGTNATEYNTFGGFEANAAYSGISRINLNNLSVEFMGHFRREDLQYKDIKGCYKAVKIGSKIYLQRGNTTITEIDLEPFTIIEGTEPNQQTLTYFIIKDKAIDVSNADNPYERIIDLCNVNGKLFVITSNFSSVNLSSISTTVENFGTKIFELSSDFTSGNFILRKSIKGLFSKNEMTIAKVHSDNTSYNKIDNCFYVSGFNNTVKVQDGVGIINHSKKISVYKVYTENDSWYSKKVFTHNPKIDLTYNSSDVIPYLEVENIDKNVYIKIISSISNNNVGVYMLYRKNGIWQGKVMHQSNNIVNGSRNNNTYLNMGVIPTYVFLDENNIVYNNYFSPLNRNLNNWQLNDNRLYILRDWDTNNEEEEIVNQSSLSRSIDATDNTTYKRKIMATVKHNDKLIALQSYTRVPINSSSITFKAFDFPYLQNIQEIFLPSYQEGDTSGLVVKYIKTK